MRSLKIAVPAVLFAVLAGGRAQGGETVGAWVLNDVKAGLAESKSSGKPLLVAFR